MKRQFLVEIECDDPYNVLYSEGLEVVVEDFMEGYKTTGHILESKVDVRELN